MNPVALITGGTRGIGLGIAKELVDKGYNLAINGVREASAIAPALELLKNKHTEIEYFQGNISQAEDRKKILSGVKSRFGSINVLVNNAGVAPRVRADILELQENDYDHLMDINLRGTFFLTQAFSSWMVELKKSNPNLPLSIINITSVSAELASTNRAAYCISKAGLSMLSKIMAVRMAEEGINVYEIRPGIIETDMTDKVKDSYLAKIKDGLTLEPRMGQPKDIGKVVAALAEGYLPYSTGQIFTVDGGLTIERL